RDRAGDAAGGRRSPRGAAARAGVPRRERRRVGCPARTDAGSGTRDAGGDGATAPPAGAGEQRLEHLACRQAPRCEPGAAPLPEGEVREDAPGAVGRGDFCRRTGTGRRSGGSGDRRWVGEGPAPVRDLESEQPSGGQQGRFLLCRVPPGVVLLAIRGEQCPTIRSMTVISRATAMSLSKVPAQSSSDEASLESAAT